MENQQVLDRFVFQKSKFDRLLEKLAVYSDDHFGILPKYVNWSHVNTVIDASRKLQEAANILNIDVED